LSEQSRQRDAFFGENLFADPAWDMLLELYARHVELERIAVSDLCIAANVPATTALRWIVKLERDGLVTRVADGLDARRCWLELSPAGLDSMRRYMDAMSFASTSI
jgi:DNA-binding MarR family transcriptional regulator